MFWNSVWHCKVFKQGGSNTADIRVKHQSVGNETISMNTCSANVVSMLVAHCFTEHNSEEVSTILVQFYMVSARHTTLYINSIIVCSSALIAVVLDSK